MSKQAVDLIVVGSGASGCGAALAAAVHGLNPLLVEKAPLLGGGTTYSYGGLWIGENHLEAAAGIDDSRDEARAYLEFLAGGAAIAANLNTYIDQAPVVLRRLEDWGLRFRIIPKVPDHYYPTAPGSRAEGRTLEAVTLPRDGLGPWAQRLDSGPYLPPGVAWSDAVAWGGFGNRRNWDEKVLQERADQGLLAAGQALVGQLLGAALQRGVTVHADFAVRELLVSNGRVTGICGSHRGEEVTVEATRGVVLATGSYESSPELIRQLEGVPGWQSQFSANITGDGLRMATEIGAAIYRAPVNLSIFLGYLIPSAAGHGEATYRMAGISELSYPHTLMVNRAGRRFADESAFQKAVPALRHFDPLTHSYPNWPCFLIFDQEYLDRYSFAGGRPGRPPPSWLAKGDTLVALARELGIAADELEQTVAGFNEHAAEGSDPEFNRGQTAWSQRSAGDLTHHPNPNLGTVARPPYYGVQLYPSGTTSGGLLTNEYGGVIHVRGHPIPGLYACGRAMAPTVYGVGYQAGLTLTGGITFGYLAAQHAAEQAARPA